MKSLKIACNEESKKHFVSERELIDPDKTDYTDIAAAVLMCGDIESIQKINATKFRIPIFVVPKRHYH